MPSRKQHLFIKNTTGSVYDEKCDNKYNSKKRQFYMDTLWHRNFLKIAPSKHGDFCGLRTLYELPFKEVSSFYQFGQFRSGDGTHTITKAHLLCLM